MNNAQRDIAPLVKEITVPWPVEKAFHRFTEGIGEWWPLGTHSVFQKRAQGCALETKVGGRLYETRDDGETSVWGTITAVDAPNMVSFTWHPGREANTAQHVEVRFTSEGKGTRVVLTHSGWEHYGEGAMDTRNGYDKGWDLVLGLYAG
jgi:uncharacterized protein YndB with AHSA1/START domain